MMYLLTEQEHAQIMDALSKLTAAAEIHGDQFKPENNWHKMSDKGTEALAMLKAMEPVEPCGFAVPTFGFDNSVIKPVQYAGTVPLYVKEQQ